MMRMDGGNPSLGGGLRIARERKGRIFGYACIAATVGLLLRSLEARVCWVGRLVVKLIGVGWALATFLVVSALHATLQGVYSAALYRYATDHATSLPGLGPELLESAFAPKS
jgi:hypothetical protein